MSQLQTACVCVCVCVCAVARSWLALDDATAITLLARPLGRVVWWFNRKFSFYERSDVCFSFYCCCCCCCCLVAFWSHTHRRIRSVHLVLSFVRHDGCTVCVVYIVRSTINKCASRETWTGWSWFFRLYYNRPISNGLCVYCSRRSTLSVHRAHKVWLRVDGMFCYWSYKLVMLFVRVEWTRKRRSSME